MKTEHLLAGILRALLCAVCIQHSGADENWPATGSGNSSVIGDGAGIRAFGAAALCGLRIDRQLLIRRLHGRMGGRNAFFEAE